MPRPSQRPIHAPGSTPVQPPTGPASARPPASRGSSPAPPDADAGRLRRFSAVERLLPVVLSYANRTYALNDAESTPPGVEMLIPLGDPSHYRIDFSQDWGRGHTEFCGLADGLFVQRTDRTFAVPRAISMSAPNTLRVRIASDGDFEYAAAGGNRLDLRGAGASIVIEPPGLPPAEAAFAGRDRGLCVVIHRNTLRRLYARAAQELPAEVQAFLAGELRYGVARRLPLERPMLRCLEDMQGCRLEGHGRRLFIRSKAIEILCLAFDALARNEDHGPSTLSAPKTRCILKAREVLDENFAAPPSLDDLARRVGLSRSAQCDGFRRAVGRTVYDYITDRRMERAFALLTQQGTSISQIAYAVGYSHPSSFSMAIQRRFGTTPRELRRRGVTPSQAWAAS